MEQGDMTKALAELFKRFPGIGQRQAERFTRFIIYADMRYVERLAETMLQLRQVSRQCPECFIRHESPDILCSQCAGEDADILIVVEKDIDVYMLAKSAQAVPHSRYFVLGGLIPIANSDTSHLRLSQLLTAIGNRRPKEIILAMSMHPDAEHTIRYLADCIRHTFSDIHISTLGRGLSSGSELEYSDPDTLTHAIQRRDSV